MAGNLNTGILALATPTEVTLTAGGDMTITQGFHTVAANSGTTDDLSTITIDASLSTALSTYLPFVVLKAKTGHTITVLHDAAPSAGEINISSGANVVLVDEKLLVLWRSYDGTINVWVDGDSFNAPSGSWVDTGSVQSIGGVKTLASPILTTPTVNTSLTVDGIAATFANSQEVTLQAGVRTTDANVTTLASVTVAESRGIVLKATIIGVKSDHSEGIGGDILYMARRASGGNVTEIAAATIRQAEDSGVGPPLISADVDTGTQTMRIRVQGIAATTYDWVVTYSYHLIASNA